tara:strand:+ start:36 stop:239 length:204 start_codon:yes stop_codon:yes gene_type:complete
VPEFAAKLLPKWQRFKYYTATLEVLLELHQEPCRGVAQLGSAPAWGAGGRRFKSCRPDQLFLEKDII